MTAFHHNKTARKTGEFIGINMNDITLLQILARMPSKEVVTDCPG